MLTDENSLYFITAKGKAFYAQLMENPYMAEIYPQEESRTALEVFRVSEGTGEFFDLSVKPIFRDTFVLGGHDPEAPGVAEMLLAAISSVVLPSRKSLKIVSASFSPEA